MVKSGKKDHVPYPKAGTQDVDGASLLAVPCRGGNLGTRAKSQRNGRTQKWMVYFRENPNLKGMMTGGTPMDWKPPYGKNTF
jgi:hypothetical protein